MPTRLFKWSFALLVVLAFISADSGDILYFWHKLIGYALLTLILWRVMWGFAGSTTARFSTFVTWPWRVVGYAVDLARGRKPRYLGHNPLGAWMVVAILAIILFQAVTGLLLFDDKFAEGPLYAHAPAPVQRFSLAWHNRLSAAMITLGVVHVAANVLYTFVRKEPLIQAMVTGRKPAAAYADAVETRGGSLGLAAALLAISAAIVWGGVYLAAGMGAFR